MSETLPMPTTSSVRHAYADLTHTRTAGDMFDAWLAAHDREVKAAGFREYADYLDAITAAHGYAMDDDDWDEHRRVTASLRAWADHVQGGGHHADCAAAH